MEYWALIVFVISSSITPGPNNVMITASGVNFGLRRSVPHLLGIELGFALMVLLVGLGVSSVFTQFPFLLIWLKVMGVLYLSYLAARIAFSHTAPEKAKLNKPFGFMAAALFQWLNPKAWVMAIGSVVTFTTPDGNYFLQVASISLLYLLLGTPCTSSWLLFGHYLRNWLATPAYLRRFNVCMGALLLLSLLPVILELWSEWLF